MADAEKSAPGEVDRLVILTDGVLAITMTLLVLDIRLPHAPDTFDNAALWQAILGIGPQIFSYVLSFLVIASFWMSHARKFQYVKRVSGPLMWLNIAFLLSTGLVPFTTSVLAESGNGVATALYAGLMAVASLLLAAMSVHASKAGLLDDRVGKGGKGMTVKQVTQQSLLSAAVFIASIPLAFWNASWAKYLWLLLIPVSLVQARLPRAPAAK